MFGFIFIYFISDAKNIVRRATGARTATRLANVKTTIMFVIRLLVVFADQAIRVRIFFIFEDTNP